MKSTEYYQLDFSSDLKRMTDASPKENRISIHFMTMRGKTKTTLEAIKYPKSFLFCYFYSVLLDQSIHSTLSHAIHQDFEKIANYPKLAGLFHSFNSNMHPAYLLLIATTYIQSENKEDILDDFKDLTHIFLEDYIDFFKNVFPLYSMYRENENEQNRALKLIFSEIYTAMKWDNVPKEMKTIMPNLDLYKSLLFILKEELKQYPQFIEKKEK